MSRSFAAATALLTCLLGSLGTPQQGCSQEAPRGQDSVRVRAVAAKTVVRPGDEVPVAVILEHAPGFHTWPNTPVVPPPLRAVRPIATALRVVSLPEGAQVGEIQWPEPVSIPVRYTGRRVDLLSYADTVAIYVPLTLAPDQAAGDVTLELRVRYQACDELVCYRPKTVTLAVPLEVVEPEVPKLAQPTEPEVFREYSLEANRSGPTGYALPAYINVFGWSLSFSPQGPEGLALMLLLAALGGLLLNVTPCVLPVIPIKVLGLQAAAGNPRRLLLLGTTMALGVIAFWFALGGAIALIAGFDAVSSLFQTGWFSPLVGLIVGLAGLGMLGLFDVRLPQFAYRIDPRQETVPGSFVFGIMTAVLSTPCTAPFMAGASAWAVLQRPPATLATFAAIGTGMALPYLALSARPGLLGRIPRSGPGSLLVKQVIGLLLLAVAAFFLGSGLSATLQRVPEPPGRGYWWVVGAFGIAACGWFVYRTAAIVRSTRWRTVAHGAALAVAVVTLVAARALSSHGPIDWVVYTPERFAESEARGDVIVLDFTAEWCLNCKALESGVLHQNEIVQLLGAPGTVPMRVDLTSGNPPGQAKLRDLGWVGIPLLAVFGPGIGYQTPVMYDSYTPGMVRAAVARAQAAPAGSST